MAGTEIIFGKPVKTPVMFIPNLTPPPEKGAGGLA